LLWCISPPLAQNGHRKSSGGPRLRRFLKRGLIFAYSGAERISDSGFFIRISHRIAPAYATTTEKVGRAMIKVAREGYARPVLESEDINAVSSVNP
jgi:hypothetical protein